MMDLPDHLGQGKLMDLTTTLMGVNKTPNGLGEVVTGGCGVRDLRRLTTKDGPSKGGVPTDWSLDVQGLKG